MHIKLCIYCFGYEKNAGQGGKRKEKIGKRKEERG
jgi:hypothetical protein